MPSTEVVQIQVVGPTRESLERIVERLVADRLVACGQLVPGLASTYWWNGSIERASEWLALLKTRADRVEDVVRIVAELHDYDVPEVIVVPVTGGLPAYLDWVREEAAEP